MHEGRSCKGVGQRYKLKLRVEYLPWQFETLAAINFPNLRRFFNIHDIQNKGVLTYLTFKKKMAGGSSYFHGVEYAKQFMW